MSVTGAPVVRSFSTKPYTSPTAATPANQNSPKGIFWKNATLTMAPTNPKQQHGTQPTNPPPIDTTADDEATVKSGRQSGRPSSRPTGTANSWKDHTIKLRFQSNNTLQTTDVSHMSFAIFQAINASFPTDVKIFTNEGKVVKSLRAPTRKDDFEKLYKVTHYRGNKARGQRPSSWIIFRISTPLTLSEIRKDENVRAALSNTSCRLQYYPWEETQRDSVSLGFLLGYLPKYMTSEQMQEELMPILTAGAGRTASRIPSHRCVLENVQALSPSGRKYTCQAFGIQVQRQDAVNMKDILAKAFPINDKATSGFIFYGDRRSHPTIFSKAVHRQAEITDQYRVVAIKGIDPEFMFDFEGPLCQEFPSILKVLRTPSTYRLGDDGLTTGRYNLLCKKDEFVTLARSLSQGLIQCYHALLDKAGVEISHEVSVTVVSKFPSGDDKSLGSLSESSLTTRNSYLTTLETAFSEYDPDDSTIPSTVWGPPASAPSPSVSSLTTPRTYASVTVPPPPPPPVAHPVGIPESISAQLVSMQEQIIQLQQANAAQLDTIQQLVQSLQLKPPSPKRKILRRSSVETRPPGRSSSAVLDTSMEDTSDVDDHES